MSSSDLVECRSDYAYPQRPVAFYWQGTRVEVMQVLAHSLRPDGYIFTVRNEELGIFELHYDLNADQWSVQQL